MHAQSFFGIPIMPYTLPQQLISLLLAVLLGGAVGLERELRGHPAGLRTQILVCVGATLITMVSVQFGRGIPGAGADVPGRIAANVVVGIGFLGAGAIIRDGMTVYGLTTAASVWVTAGIGIALGAGPHLAQLAVIAAAIVVSVLFLLTYIEDALHIKTRYRNLMVDLDGAPESRTRLTQLLTSHGLTVYSITSAESGQSTPTRQRLTVRIGIHGGLRREELVALMVAQPWIEGFNLE